MKHLLSLLALAAATGAYAQGISTDDARQRAVEFFTQRSAAAGPHRAPAKIDPVLAYTIEGDGSPCLYVFNRAADADGFVIINADAAAEVPILGYSESTAFDSENLPDNFRWWLEQYKENGVSKAPAKAAGVRHDVEPIIKTKWGQNTPFNNILDSETRYNFVTGCTATAMAQIMKHYEYPAKGKGTKSYTSEITVNKTQYNLPITVDFSTANYDWANMRNEYSGTYSAEEGNAVAQLMYHAGVAEGTNYGDTDSSADDRNSGKALIQYFDYDPGMLRAERLFVSDDDWNNILYEELAAGRPIMYSGSTVYNEGHCFICDGYKDGLYHFNWGWNGTSDGYFAITGSSALRPGSQGTGGAPSGQGFVCSQSINYNIIPRTQNEPAVLLSNFAFQKATSVSYQPYRIKRVSTGLGFSQDVDCSAGDEYISLYCVPYNYGLQEVTAALGVKLVNSATNEEYLFANNRVTLPAGGYPMEYTIIKFNTKEILTDGEYEVIPIYRDYYNASSPWRPMVACSFQDKVTLNISNTANRPSNVPLLLTVEKVTPKGDPYVFSSPEDFKIKVTAANNSGATLTNTFVCPRIACDNGRSYSMGRGWVSVPAGYKGDIEIDLYDSDYSFTPGKVYTIEFYKSTSFDDPTNEPLPGIPSYSFIYASPTPSVNEVISVVRELKGGRGTIPMLQYLVNKILGK